jgi:SAM-dependent methyltransferase
MPVSEPAGFESAEELARNMLAGLEMRRFLPPAGPHLPELWPSLAPVFDPVVDPVPPRPGLLGRVRNRLRRAGRALVLPGLRLWGRLNRLADRALPPWGPLSPEDRDAARRGDAFEVVCALGHRLNHLFHEIGAARDRLALLEEAAGARLALPDRFIYPRLPAAPARVLDLGAERAAELAGLGYRAVEVATSPERRRRALGGRPAFARVTAGPTRLPFAPGGFDAVLAVWHGQADGPVGALIAEARRVLRPGGRLLLALAARWAAADLDALLRGFTAVEYTFAARDGAGGRALVAAQRP